MRKQLVRSICLGGLAATGLLLWQQQPVSAAETVKVDIRNAGGFKFFPADVKISAGDTIQWVPAAGTHNLVGDNGFNNVPDFDPPVTPTQIFNTPGTIKYHCIYHKTMTGTITVK
ncbi:MAG: cupredoxin domain-containing protein [Methylocella sp.]